MAANGFSIQCVDCGERLFLAKCNDGWYTFVPAIDGVGQADFRARFDAFLAEHSWHSHAYAGNSFRLVYEQGEPSAYPPPPPP